MFKTRENDVKMMKHFLQHSVQICRVLQIFPEPNNDQYNTITYSKLTITMITPTNDVSEILQHQHFINTSTNPEGCHKSNFIRQNEVNMAKDPFKVQQPILESSSEMDKLQCITNAAHSLVTITTVMGTIFFLENFE